MRGPSGPRIFVPASAFLYAGSMRLYLVIAVCLLTLAGCAKNEPVADEIIPKRSGELKKYELTGEVARLDAENKIATIKHEAIGDWMGPMTMEFPVKDAADFSKLSLGKPVHGTVFVEGVDFWLAEVKDTPPSTPSKPTK